VGLTGVVLGIYLAQIGLSAPAIGAVIGAGTRPSGRPSRRNRISGPFIRGERLMRMRFVGRPVRAVRLGLCLTMWVGAPRAAFAQGAAAGPVTMNDAIQLALKNYPAMKESRARAQAARETIGVARTAYLPRLDVLWQGNRA